MSHQVSSDLVVAKRPKTPLFLTSHGSNLAFEAFSTNVLLMKREDVDLRLRRKGIEPGDVQLCPARVIIQADDC